MAKLAWYNLAMNRKITFAPGEFYHIYNRGVEKRSIFSSDTDRKRFQALLYLCNGNKAVVYRSAYIQGSTLYMVDAGDKSIAIGAYVLMPNHFHLLVKETSENGITEFMRRLTTAYTMYFNKKYKRVGPLFQGTFKAEHVDEDRYLKYLFSYIHLNPIKLFDNNWKENGIKDKRGAQKYLAQYKFSSYNDYAGTGGEQSKILSQSEFPQYFEKFNDFRNLLDFWLMYKVEP